MGMQKPTYFLMEEAKQRIIICGQCEHEARDIRNKLGLFFKASIYSGLTAYRVDFLKSWKRVDAGVLLAELKKDTRGK